jgi:hypothetical protein
MRRLAAATALAALLAAGCKTGSAVTSSPDPSTNEGTWAAARDRSTRTHKLYDVLDDVAFATATYQAPAVRAARVDRLADWKGSLPAEREAAQAKERAEGAAAEEFLLAFFTADRSANDLSKPTSTWRVSLVVNGTEHALPTKIEFVRADPTLRMLYPYISDFDTLYRIRFPRFPGEAPLASLPFQLRIASALGRVELSWKP